MAVTLTWTKYSVRNNRLSTAHPETMFIIVHQVSELWLKLILHELSATKQHFAEDNIQAGLKLLERVKQVFRQLISAWDVMRSLTPADYLSFRDALGEASGLQSWQYRALEYLFGNTRSATIRMDQYSSEVQAQLSCLLNASSLYDEALQLLHRRGFTIAISVLQRNFTRPYQSDDSVCAAWQKIYQNPEDWELYRLAEHLIELEDFMRCWRFNHLTVVERVIGHKTGTGKTSGVDYLKHILSNTVYFPELWAVRTKL